MENNQIIFDININSIQDLYNILLKQNYEFVVLEADEEKVSVKFRKEWKFVEEKFIKYNIYSEIVIKAKTISNLDVWVTNEEQEWKWKIKIEEQEYESLAKTIPSKVWEKLFLKLKKIEAKPENKASEKPIELGKFVGFIASILVVLLIVWSAYLGFIILNAKTIDDVRFFRSLWINLNEINDFLKLIVRIFFSALTFILTILLIVYWSRFLLTKKIFKRKKIKLWILTTLFFILTFASATAWMTLDRKINDLPRWDILALWDIVIYDNSIYNSIIYEDSKLKNQRESNSVIKDYSNLIWPINLRIDIKELARKEQTSWSIVKKYIWKFSDWMENEETLEPILPEKLFEKKWIFKIEVDIEMQDQLGNTSIKTLKNIPEIGIGYIVWIKEKELKNWAKQITFDASSIRNLWKIKWYSWDDWVNPVHTWETYITKWIFEETRVWMIIWDQNQNLNRIFVIWWNKENEISWDIDFTPSALNDKEITLKVTNLKANEWIWFIEKYEWTINGRKFSKEWDIEDPEKSSEQKYLFPDYGKYEIAVELFPSSGSSKKISKNIEIKRNLKIQSWVTFSVNWEKFENVRHNIQTWEYFLNEFWVPAKLEIDARYSKTDNVIYSLDEVHWDYDSDWEIDEKWKRWSYQIIKEWRNKITITYIFKNIKIDEKTEIKETIYVEAVKKDQEITFNINQPSEYAPVIVWFDASKSYVKDGNITKFIWDFGDGITEEGDAVVKWHRYLVDWEYDVSLTVVTSSWQKFSTTKKLVLKPKAQRIKISSSMIEAPTFQWIDFNSSESIGDIENFTWDFGDGEVSTEANPTHSYKTPWTYKVKLTWEFRNRNIMEDMITVTITN